MEFSENYVSIIVDGEDWRHSEQLRPEEIEELKRCRIIIQLKWGLQHLYPRLRLADGGQYRGVHGGLRREGVGVALNPKNGKLLHNKLERSGVDNIYAIGDVLGGKRELPPVAIQVGKRLARRLVRIWGHHWLCLLVHHGTGGHLNAAVTGY